MLHRSEIFPNNINAQTRLPLHDISACSLADSNKCLEHSCINFTFPLLPLNWFILHLFPARCFYLSSESFHILYVAGILQACEKPRDMNQADVIISEFSDLLGYALLSLPLISDLLIPIYNCIPDLSDRVQLSGGDAMLCDRIRLQWVEWKEAINIKAVFTFRIHCVRCFFNVCGELSSQKIRTLKIPNIWCLSHLRV